MYIISNQQMETLARLAEMACELIPTHTTRNANIVRLGRNTLRAIKTKQPVSAEDCKKINKLV